MIMRIKRYRSSSKNAENTKMKILRYCSYLYTIFPIAYLFVFLHYLFRKRKSNFKYEVSLCLIFKNEAPFLREWLEYHLLLGVDHFYLYNNFSDDNYLDVLKPYIDKEIVTLIEWPYKYAQVAAYNDCYTKCRKETHWLGYIDADEYINLLKNDNIKDFLSGYKVFPSVLLCWKMFGTSGYMEEEKEYLVTERYVASWPYLCETGKSFINNEYIFSKISIHYDIASVAKIPIFGVTDTKIFAPFMFHAVRWNSPKAYINHYWSKSREYYFYKDFLKGEVAIKQNEKIKKDPGRFECHELNNSAHDYSIQRWLIFLKERLKNYDCKLH